MPRSTGRTIVLTVLATLVFLCVAGLAFAFSGVYDVSATTDHTALGAWFLGEVRERSVSARAADLPEPPPADSAALAHGFEHFRAMCVSCHGAPGVDRGEMGLGMTPTPPDLAEEAEELDAKELFWVTKNGLKLAGMPGFGPTHSDEELWGIVAFLGELPGMTAEQYQGWVERYAPPTGADAAQGGHEHAPGTPPHSH